jgi:3-dehydroquinate dehydratase type I
MDMAAMKSRPKGAKLIISYHDFDRTPTLEELKKIVGEMLAKGADICKVVTKALTVEDNLIPLRLLAESQAPMIAFCLGKKGRISRIMAPQFGSLISYVPPTADFVTAEGQIVFDEWMKIQKMLARG